MKLVLAIRANHPGDRGVTKRMSPTGRVLFFAFGYTLLTGRSTNSLNPSQPYARVIFARVSADRGFQTGGARLTNALFGSVRTRDVIGLRGGHCQRRGTGQN